MKKIRDILQQRIYQVINPVVRLLIKAGLTPNAVTTIGLLLNIGVAIIFVFGAEKSNRGELSYIGWAGAMVLFAGLFDMLDGQVARIGNMSSTFGALYDSVLDRYSELVMFLGICYYLVSHHYFLSSLFAFIALIGSMMVSYTRARAEGLGIESKGGIMQRPERIILIGTSAVACGITGHYIGGDYRLYIAGIPFHVFEAISVFTIPLTLMAIMTNITAIGRLRDAKRALDAKDELVLATEKPRKAGTEHLFVTLALVALVAAPYSSRSADIQTVFPVPSNIPRLMFYIQRTPNTNTICYELNESEPGIVNEDEPIHVFWLRYAEENGRRKELNFIQRKFAYGLKVTKLGKDNYDIRSVAYPKKLLHLQKISDNQYHVFASIAGRRAILKRIFIEIDGGSFWKPNVIYIELKGVDVVTGNALIERIKP